MASSYTPLLRLTLPTTGELQGTWGDTVNNGITSLTEAAIAGTAAIVMSDANHTLTVANGATDEARRMFVTLTGALTATRDVICPAVSKMYVVRNNTTGGQSIVFKTSAGTGITVANGQSALLYCDGTNVVEAFSAFGGNAATATALQTTRTLWGQNFNGTANVTGNLSSVGNITGTASVTLTATNGSLGLAATGANIIHFLTNGTERMRIDSAGNVGIGTSSPGANRLQVSGSVDTSATNIRFTDSGGRAIGIETPYDGFGVGYIGTYNTGSALGFKVNGTERMRLDTSGNLGIGVVPSAWGSSFKVLQLPAGAISADGTAVIEMRQNSRWTGSANVYVNNGFASNYYQYNGTHSWFTAPSGTAGNAISFTQAMTLSLASNLLLGTTTDTGDRLALFTSPGGVQLRWSDGTNSTAWLDTITAASRISTNTNLVFSLGASPASAVERMRIDSAGNLLVGTTSIVARVSGVANSGVVAYFTNTSGTGVALYPGNTGWSAVSDERAKIIEAPIADAANKVASLRAVIGRYKIDDAQMRRAFLIAQDVQAVLPEAVTEQPDGMLAMQMTDTIPLLVAAIQELNAKIDAQAAEIAALKGAA